MNIDVQKLVIPRPGLDHGSAFRADVLTIAPPRLPTLYAKLSIYKPLTSFILLSDLLFPAVGAPIILFSACLTYGRLAYGTQEIRGSSPGRGMTDFCTSILICLY